MRFRAWVGVLLGSTLLSSCAGIFQRDLRDPSRWERAARGAMKVGSASVDVTPTEHAYLAGFSPGRSATGVHEPLMARVLVVSVGGEELVMVGLDNLGPQQEDVEYIKGGIEGVMPGNVFVCSSHTHSGPDLVGIWGYWFLTSGRDRGYLMLLRQRIAQAVAEARRDLQPARLRYGKVRLPREGLLRNSNRRHLFDPRFHVLHFVHAETDAPVGTLFHLACHPEVEPRRGTLLSADFVGPLCRIWEERGHGPAMFVNGALGALVANRMRGTENVVPMGERLVEFAETSLAQAEDIEVQDMALVRSEVFLPLDSYLLRIGRQTTLIPREVYGGCLRSTVSYLRLGSLEIAMVPGEMEPGLAAKIRALSHRPNLLVFGLVDDEVGYLMDDRTARDPEFSYERGMGPGVRGGEQVTDALVAR